MLRPSVVLSLLTAMLTAEASQASASAPSHQHLRTMQSPSVPADEPSEDQEIAADARRTLGNELRKL